MTHRWAVWVVTIAACIVIGEARAQSAPPTGVSLTTTPPALVAASPVPLTGFGRGTPVSATVFVSSSTGAALNFTSTPSTASGGSWLSVSISPTTTPQTLTIQANPANLDVGSYTGTVTLACTSDTPCTGTSIAVNLTVQPGITVNPPAFTPTATHSNQTTNLTLTVTSQVFGGLPFTVACPTTDGGPLWLLCMVGGTATTSGTQFQVITHSGGMAPNATYHGTVSVTGGGATINVPVTFQLQGAQLTLSPSTINITMPGASISPSQNVAVGPAGFTATASPTIGGPGFLNVLPSGSFSTGTNIQIAYNAAFQSTATNIDSTVAIQCVSDNCFDATLPVHVTVTVPPTLSITPSTLSTFSVVQGTVSTSQTVQATSSDGSSLPFTVTGPSWVTLSVPGGTATGTALPVSISVDAHSLPSGTASGTVTFACTVGSTCTSVLQLPITANVTSGATLTSNPTSVTFTAYQGRNAGSKNIVVTANDGSAIPFTVSGVPSWLNVIALNGTTGQASGTLTLTLNPNPPAAAASGSLTLTPTSSSVPPLVIPLSLTVSPFTIGASPSPLSITVVSGQTQTVGLSITTIDGASAQVSIAATGSPILPTLGSASLTAPGNVNVTADATSVATGSYNATITLTCGAANPCAPVPVPVQMTVTASQAPVITPNGIVPIYSTSTTIQSGSWVSIYGSNLASSPQVWAGDFPTSLGATSVSNDNKLAYINFVAPGQVNVQAPDDANTGTVPVVITTSTGTTSSTVTLGQFGPSFSVAGGKYIAGIVIRNDGSGTQGGGTYDFIGPNGNSLGYPTRPVKTGDVVELYGVGFGPVTPPIPAGQVVPAGKYGTATSDIEFQIGGINVKPAFAGITEAGLFQFNLTIPAGIGTGDVPIVATVGGLQTQAGIFIAAQ